MKAFYRTGKTILLTTHMCNMDYIGGRGSRPGKTKLFMLRLFRKDKVKNMDINNYFRMVIPGYSRNESFARTAAAAFAAQLDPTIEEINDIKAAVSEAVTNCIVHAYPEKKGDIEITARIINGDVFYIRIKDKGCGIADIKQAMLPLFSTCEEGERAGLGFAVMESFMDKLRVTSRLGKGTSVIMTKRVKSE